MLSPRRTVVVAEGGHHYGSAPVGPASTDNYGRAGQRGCRLLWDCGVNTYNHGLCLHGVTEGSRIKNFVQARVWPWQQDALLPLLLRENGHYSTFQKTKVLSTRLTLYPLPQLFYIGVAVMDFMGDSCTLSATSRASPSFFRLNIPERISDTFCFFLLCPQLNSLQSALPFLLLFSASAFVTFTLIISLSLTI